MKRGARRVTKAANKHAQFTQADIRTAVVGLRGPVFFRAPLRDYTSFRIGGPADVLVEPVDIEDITLVVGQARAHKIPLFVLGGTNLLIRDGGIRGVVISLARLRGIKEEPGSILYAEGGVGMPTLLNMTSSRPKCSAAAATVAATSSSRDTSARTATAVPPAPSMSRTVSLARSSSRSAHTTRAPSSAKRRDEARPTPEPAA